MNSNLFPIAKEGWNYILISFSLFFFSYLFELTLLCVVFFVLTLFFVYSFRNPEREITNYSDGSILSPCDGIVASIVELENTQYSYKIEVENSFFDIGILRAPMDSTVDSIVKYNGSRVSSKSPLYKDLNEYAELVFKNENNSLRIIHRLKRSFAPLFIHSQKNMKLKQSERYAFMANGVTAIYLSNNFRINVKIGDKVKASESLIGYFSK